MTVDGMAGRVALVTGAGSGIGQQVAVRLAEAGARVLAVDRDASGLDATKDSTPGRIQPLVMDVGRRGAADEALAAAAALGQPSLLVLCAAMIDRHPFLEADDDVWQAVLDTNVTAYASFTRAASNIMRRAGDGRIVLISSVNGHIGSPLVPYSVSKSAVHGLVRSVAPVLAPHGIRINSISPGVIETGMNADRLADGDAKDREVAGIPLGRLGTPDDIAQAVLFLLGDGASYITGADLVIDGAFSYARPGRPARTMPSVEPGA